MQLGHGSLKICALQSDFPNIYAALLINMYFHLYFLTGYPGCLQLLQQGIRQMCLRLPGQCLGILLCICLL